MNLQWQTNHTQCETLNGTTSKWREAYSKVRPGSVLGPVLLKIFINDLDEGLEGEFIKFPHDTNLVEIDNTLENRLKVQKDLDQTWAFYSLWATSHPLTVPVWPRRQWQDGSGGEEVGWR